MLFIVEIYTKLNNFWRSSELSFFRKLVIIISKILKKLFWPFKVILYKIFPKYDLYGWKNRTQKEAKSDYSSINLLERLNFLESSIDFTSISSFLELGCNSGVNLIPLAAKYPKIRFAGVDFNSKALKFSSKTSQDLGLTNINFHKFDIQSRQFWKFLSSETNKFEVIFSWATLIYVHPFKIKRVLDALVENCATQLILIEQEERTYKRSGLLIPGQPTWIRSYRDLILDSAHKIDGKLQIEVREVMERDWHPAGGGGRLIVCSKTSK